MGRTGELIHVSSNFLTTWLGEHRVDGRVVARIGRRGSDLIAEFVDIGTFGATGEDHQTYFLPAKGADPSSLTKLTGGLVDALLRHLQGKVTFHGGAVALGSNAVAFVGPSGSGKSTLAAALCAGPDIELVADDTVAIELREEPSPSLSVEVLPTQTAAWLLPDARRALGFDSKLPDKVPLKFRSTASRKLTLNAIVNLVFDSETFGATAKRLRGQDAFVALSSSAIRFVIDDAAAQAQEFEQFRSIVYRCPIFELRRSRNLELLGQSADRIRDLLLGHPE
jgi:hypothetical protein